MIRIYSTLLLSFAITMTTYSMNESDKKTPDIEITPPEKTLTIKTIPHTNEKKSSPRLLTKSTPSIVSKDKISHRSNKKPSLSLTHSDPFEESKESFTQTSPRENTSQKNITTHRPLTRTQSASSDSKESSPRKLERKHPSNSLTQSNSSLSNDDSDTENPLLIATKKNDLNKVLIILNINIPDKEGNTPFIIAAKNGFTDIIYALLKQPTLNPNMQNIHLMTALHCAAREGHKKIVKTLVLDPRVDTSITENNNWTALNYLNLDKKCRTLKDQLFGRITLDTFVNKEVSAIHRLINNNMLSDHLAEEDFNRSIQMIKKNITEIANHQDKKDRQLSIDAIIPHYATDAFIKQMVKLRFFSTNKPISPINQILFLQPPLTNDQQKNTETSSLFI